MQFRILPGLGALLAACGTDDELVVFAPEACPTDLSDPIFDVTRPVVLASISPDTAGERIDETHFWLGLLVMPARALRRLDSLPDDYALTRVLLRAALQAGVAVHPVKSPAGLAFVQSAGQASALARRLVEVGKDGAMGTPSGWLASRLERAVSGWRSWLLPSATSALCLGTMGSATFDVPWLALPLAAASYIGARAVAKRSQTKGRLRLDRDGGRQRGTIAFKVAAELAVGSATFATLVREVDAPFAAFVAFTVLAATYISGQARKGIVRDRLVLAMLLLGGLIAGKSAPVAMVVTVMALAERWWSHSTDRQAKANADLTKHP